MGRSTLRPPPLASTNDVALASWQQPDTRISSSRTAEIAARKGNGGSGLLIVFAVGMFPSRRPHTE